MLVIDGTARKKLAKLRDPRWFIPRFMQIIDTYGKLRNFDPLTGEQIEALDALIECPNVLALKSRQLGMTTLGTAFFAHRATYCTPEQYNVLTMTHEMDAMSRVNGMLKTFIAQLPSPIRPPQGEPWNGREVALGHNGSIFKQLMAGGRSQGRSYTYQGLHATEMGFWPRGSAATSNRRSEEGADKAVWASVLSTLHGGPLQRIFIESTADGPSGVFYEQVKLARESKDWKFLFFPWFKHKAYRRRPPPGWERTDEEEVLATAFGLDDAQLAWRRWKLNDQGYELQRFRKEFPSTWEEPFLVSSGMWWNAERLNLVLAGVPSSWLAVKDGERRFAPPEPGRRYYIGVDPSGGVGRDWAVVQVLRDDWTQVATFSSRKTPPHQIAEVAVKLSVLYNRARILCEENNHGKAVLLGLRKLGGHLYLERGKDVWMDPTRKRALYSHAREAIDMGYVDLTDPETLRELLRVREQADGNIEADEGYNDDHVSALVLALWNARESAILGTEKSMAQRAHEQRLKRHKELGLVR